ncbi:MAG: guanylate kinase [Firmicutes bacterium]|nr:guanylate kinase [Bacillota bacterium]
MKKGLLLILSGPSGSGKGTVVDALLKQGNFALSISATTRAPRDYEREGEHYFFKTPAEFLSMQKRGELLEWAQFCGNYYGTPKDYVEKRLQAGENIILEIEAQGALQVKKKHPTSVLIFILPPDVEELKNRLLNRGSETEESIAARLKQAVWESEIANKYDYLVINNFVDDAVDAIKTIISAEHLKVFRNTDAINRFKGEIK